MTTDANPWDGFAAYLLMESASVARIKAAPFHQSCPRVRKYWRREARAVMAGLVAKALWRK